MNNWRTYKDQLQRIPWANYGRCVVRYAVVCLLVVAIWRTYEEPILAAFNKIILPVLAIFKANAWNKTLTYSLSAILLYVLPYRNIKHRYLYNPHLVLVLGWSAVILGYYRWSGTYNYESLSGRLTFVDVLIFFAVLVVIAAIVNYIRAIVVEMRTRHKENPQEGVLYDNPICTLDEDALDWSDEVGKLLGVVNQLQKSQPISIAINAHWGAGKTSFLKILQSSIDKDRYEVVYFNPRESKTASEIQEDFFQQIIAALSKFNGDAEYNLKKYMQALQVIDDKNWITKLLNIYAILNKESYREKIKRICDKLPVKVIIIIDDFDRLLPDEILEVLKLINTNATFSNFIFFTAYDKNIVNNMLEKLGKTVDAYFTDKYFDLEYSLPIRAYKYILDYFVDNLCSTLHLNNGEKERIKMSVEEHAVIIQASLPTIRDAKRLINQILLDYHLVEGEVDVVEFIYVQLIKYKYPSEYKALAKKEYVTTGIYSLYLSDEVPSDNLPACMPILQVLFAKNEDDYKTLYRHIYAPDSFDMYFYNKIDGSLKIQEMRSIFNVEYGGAREMIDGWIKNKQAAEFSNYLQSLYISSFSSKSMLFRYAVAAAYFALKSGHEYGDTAFKRAIYIPVLQQCAFLDLSEYKKFILDIVGDRTIDPYLFNMRNTHYFYVHRVFDEDNSLIKDVDIWPVIKSHFLRVIEDDNIPEAFAYDYIWQCVDHLDNEKKSILDIDCCRAYRRYLDKHPHIFIETFVRQKFDMATIGWNYLECNLFYLQIFESDENLIEFVKICIGNDVPNSIKVLNFIKLFMANEHEAVEILSECDIKEFLDKTDFSTEIEQLEQLQSIDRTLDEMLDDRKLQGEERKKELQKMYSEIQSINLRVALRERLHKMLKELLEF